MSVTARLERKSGFPARLAVGAIVVAAGWFGGASATLAAGSCDFTPTAPTPAPGPSIFKLSADQASQPKVDTEWWWLVGTLKSTDKTFGVEVNIARFSNALAQSWVMISDVTDNTHIQEVLNYPMSELKASDTEFSAALPNVTMSGPLDGMAIHATLPEGKINLVISQKGPPLSVWGTGQKDTGKFVTNYYSLTNLSAKGTLTTNGKTHDVAGLMWMDHEFGGWAAHIKWAWAGLQLDNGVSIMSFTTDDTDSVIDKPRTGSATILMPDGKEYLEDATLTPRAPAWTSPHTGHVYYMGWTVAIPGLNACLDIRNAPTDQEFLTPAIADVVPASGIYEGVSTVAGTFDGKPIAGQAWSEQVP